MLAIVLALGVFLVAGLVVVPAIEQANAQVDVSCTNPGGNQPRGQQPSCKGRGLTQEILP